MTDKKICPFLGKECIGGDCMAWTHNVWDAFSGKAVWTAEGRCKLLPGV